MKQFIVVITFLFSINTFAQPIFNASDLNLLPGESYTSFLVDSTFFNTGSSGANQSWNFTITGVPLDKEVMNIVSPSSLPIGTSFPGATIVAVVTDTAGSDYSFYNTSASSSKLLGTTNIYNAGNNDTDIYNKALTDIIYPTTYLTSFNDSLITVDSSGSFPIVFTRLVHSIADAYGDLTINGLLTNNVLRLVTTDSTNVNFVFGSIDIISKKTSWLKQGSKLPILTNLLFNINGSINNITFLDSIYFNTITSSKLLGNDVGLQVYPNPVINKLYINTNFATKSSYSIFDMFGKELKQGVLQTSRENVDVSTLPKSVYVLKILNDSKQVLVKRFIKE